MTRVHHAKAFAGLLAAALCGNPALLQGAEWADDFSDGSITDGNPVTWVTNLGGFFPGDYNASSGDLIMTPPVDDGTDGSQMSAFVPTQFTDVYIRAQGTVRPDPNNPDNDGGNLVLLGRVNPNTLSGYLVYFDVGGNLNLQFLDFGSTVDIGTTFDAPFNASEEVIVELNIVGNELSAFAWLADDPNGKPAEPQVTATDNAFAGGIAGIAYAEDEDNTFGIFRWVKAQSTPFVDLAPGDFNGDGKVDAADFAQWESEFGASLDGGDLLDWQANFGQGASVAAAVGVPEPTSCLLTASALALAAARRRR